MGESISPAVLSALGCIEVRECVALTGPTHLGVTLEPNVYREFNKVLEALGGKWNRKQQGHVFDGDPRDDLDRVLLTGGVEIPRGGKTAQQLFGFFETPAPLAERVVGLAEIESGMMVLEPSAGRGALARVVARYCGARLFCVELQASNAVVLQREVPGAGIEVADFLTWRAGQLFDRVVMNPPFARQQDIEHVRRAFSMLRPGGRLVSVMASGVEFRQNAKACDFRALVEEVGGVIHGNPEGSFRESGTNVSTVTVVLDKPKPEGV